jgi:hypothetical protein
MFIWRNRKNVMSLLLSLMFSQQNWRTRRGAGWEVTQKLYAHMSKCKNEKKKEEGKNKAKRATFKKMIIIQFGKKG